MLAYLLIIYVIISNDLIVLIGFEKKKTSSDVVFSSIHK